ncbi:redoxin domain-containing protein [bacterium]|nr:redoxin domain-containing protein [candidate division CSSED10-310 bacterium]
MPSTQSPITSNHHGAPPRRVSPFPLFAAVAPPLLLLLLLPGLLIPFTEPVQAQAYAMNEVREFRNISALADPVQRKDGYEKFLADHPDSMLKNNTKLLLAEAYGELGNAVRQIELLKELIKDDPDFMQAHYKLAEAYLGQKKLADAEQSCRAALRMLDKMSMEDVKGMNISKDQFLAIKANLGTSFNSTLAKILLADGKRDEATALLSEVIKTPPASPEQAVELARLLREMGDGEAALSLLDAFAFIPFDEVKEARGLHREIYVALKGSAEGYDQRLAMAREAADAATKKALLAELEKTPGPSYSFTALKGGTVSSGSHRGKVVVLNFWATWCRPCHSELPHFQHAYDNYKDDPKVAFLAVSTDASQTKSAVEKFITDRAYTFPVAYAGEDARKFGFEGIPALFILDGNGNIRHQRRGFDPRSDLVEELRWIIDELKKEAL